MKRTYFCTQVPHGSFMNRCLELALRGQGNVAPNPMVGCVIVHNGNIIGEGWHKQYGGSHAEVNAIKAVSDKSLLAQSQLYVNLEPCAHMGKTPACTGLIIEHKIPHVFIGMQDPFAAVNGKGISILESNGVQVKSGILERECRELNKRFIVFHTKKRPYILLKWAQSLDGFMATADTGIQISGKSAGLLLHKWRSEEAGILVGARTVNIDRPQLNVREWNGNDPRIVVLDGQLNADLSGFKEAIVFNCIKESTENGIQFIRINDTNNLQELLNALLQLEIQSVLIEGGANVLQQFLDAGICDEARIIKSKKMIVGKGLKAPEIQVPAMDLLELADDTIYFYTNYST